MAKRHLKRLNVPNTWPIRKKETIFIARPMPGPHSLRKCVTLSVLLTDILKYTKSNKEVKSILNANKVFVDKKARKEYKFPVGFMDIIEFPTSKEFYRLNYDDTGGFNLEKIKEDETERKTCKIIGKTTMKKNRLQLNLYDGKCILVDNNSYNVNDSIVYNLKTKKIEKHLKFDKGAIIVFIEGKYKGKKGVVESIKTLEGQESVIRVKSKDGEFETLKKYAFVVDK